MGVVDGLELVNVEEQDGHRRAIALPTAQRDLQPVQEERPVGQLSETVVQGLVRQTRLQRLALRDVLDVDHELDRVFLAPHDRA